jgi:hypothetical protein
VLPPACDNCAQQNKKCCVFGSYFFRHSVISRDDTPDSIEDDPSTSPQHDAHILGSFESRTVNARPTSFQEPPYPLVTRF